MHKSTMTSTTPNPNTLCYFSLPENKNININKNKTRQFIPNEDDGDDLILSLAVFCNLGRVSPGRLTLVELKGYYDNSDVDFPDIIPQMSRAQSHYTTGSGSGSGSGGVVNTASESDFPLPTMIRGTSAIDSGGYGLTRELVELPLQDVQQNHLSEYSYNYFIPLQSFYFDDSFEITGTFTWSSEDSKLSDQTFHFSFQLPNIRHKHFAQVAFGSIIWADSTAETVARGLLNCLHPIVSDMMQIRPLGRTFCYSDIFWVIRAFMTYFQGSGTAFPTLLQADALRALAGHVRWIPEGMPKHSPLVLAGIGIVSTHFPEHKHVIMDKVKRKDVCGDGNGEVDNGVELLCTLAGSFFEPAHADLLKVLCDVVCDEGKGKRIFMESNYFFEFFRSLRQGLMYLLGADVKGVIAASNCHPLYVALRSVVPLLLRAKMANIDVASLYRSESDVFIKAIITRLEDNLRDNLWTILYKSGFLVGVAQYPTAVMVSSIHEAKNLVGLLDNIKFELPDEDELGYVITSEIVTLRQHLDGDVASEDGVASYLDISCFIRKLRMISQSCTSISRHLTDFDLFYESYVQQRTDKATVSNFWSLEEFRVGVKRATSVKKSGLVLLWAGSFNISRVCTDSNGMLLPPQSLEYFSMKQPLGLASGVYVPSSIHKKQKQKQQKFRRSLFVAGMDSTLKLITPSETRNIVDSGPGSLLGTLDVAQLRAARSLCIYTIQFSVTANVTLLVIADTGNNCVKALVLSGADSLSKDGATHFPDGRLFELAKINNPVSVAVFQECLVVASNIDHVIYSLAFEKRQLNSNKSQLGWCVTALAGKPQSKGFSDGATDTALLCNPAVVAASSSKLYFIEARVGSPQALREYDPMTREIRTLHTGSPFKNLTGLCCASSDGELLICDRSNSCIWSYNSFTGDIIQAVTEDDIPVVSLLSSAKNPSTDTKIPPFRPGCIINVGDGSYIFSDISRNQIFRYLEHSTVCAAVDEATNDGIFNKCDNSVQSLELSLTQCLASIREGLYDFKDSAGILLSKRRLIATKSYVAEVNRVKNIVNANPTALQPEAITGMVLNAPSISGLSSFLKVIEVNPSNHLSTKDSIVKFMKNYDFSSHSYVPPSEFLALGDIFRYSKDSLVGQDLMCAILKCDSFRFDITPSILTMLGGLLQRLNWTMDRQKVPDLRREVIRWMGRCLPTRAQLNWTDSTHEEVLIGALHVWSSIMHQFSSENSYCKKVLAWIVRVHLDSLCMGFVNTSLTSRAERNPSYNLYSSDVGAILEDVGIQKELNSKQKNLDRALMTICSLPYIFEKASGFEMQYDLLMIFSDTVSDVARTLHVETAINALLQASVCWEVMCSSIPEGDIFPRVRFRDREMCPLSCVVQKVLFDITSKQLSILDSKVSERMNIQYNKMKNNPSVPMEHIIELENKVKHPPNWEFQVEVIVYEPYLWAHLLHWHSASVFQHSRQTTLWTNDLLRFNNRLSAIISELSLNVCRGHVSTDTLRKIHAHSSALIPGFVALGSELGDIAYMKALETEFQDALSEIETLTKVLAVISPPKCDYQASMYTIANSWHSLTLNSIREVLRLALPPCHEEQSASFIEFYGMDFEDKIRTFKPVPELLLRSLPWMYTCTNLVDFFAYNWQIHIEDGDVTDEAIITVSTAWKELLNSVHNGTVTCSTLTRCCSFLRSPEEVATLLRTGTGTTCYSNVEGINFFQVLAEDDPTVNERKMSILEKVKQWTKIRKFIATDTQVFLADLLEMATNFLNSSADDALILWKETYKSLCLSIEGSGTPWEDMTMNEVLKYTNLAAPLDEAILSVSLPLLSALASNEKLNIFLRSVVSDNAFSSALEVALGLSEMECPTEIWDSTSNRVNEKYMSMLRNIRSYLYDYFYEYPIKLHTFDSFIFIFGGLNTSMKPEIIAQNISECGVVRQALMDIVNFTSEGASSNRLMKIYEPSMNSAWSCSAASHDSDIFSSDEHDLHLEYHEFNRVERNVNVKSYALNELLDFQSNVVLSKSTDLASGDYLQATIDKFLHQFCWIRRLRESLMHLHDIGHFDYYPFYEAKYSVDLADTSFIDTVAAADERAIAWVDRVNCLRDKFYFLNFYEMKNVRKFLELLMTLPIGAEINVIDDHVLKVIPVLSDLFCFVNVDYSNDVEFLQNSAIEVLRLWKVIRSSKYSSSAVSDYLEDTCELLNQVCGGIPMRSRPALFDEDLSQHSALPILRPGLVYATKAATVHAEYSQALTMFGSSGLFPEWESCLLCSEHTTVEQVCNFIRRWQKSHHHRPFNRLFCLLEVERLSYAIQDAVIVLLRHLTSVISEGGAPDVSKPCPLILSCLSGMYQCPLAAQFQHNALSIQPFPDIVLSQMFKNASNSVRVYHSFAPGAGKTFNIRTHASANGRRCVFVPINSATMSVSDRNGIVRRLRSAIVDARVTSSTLHLDVSSSVGSSLLPLLFEVCVLGICQDYSGESVFWYPRSTVVALELACGLIDNKLQHCAIYPSVTVEANRESFVFDEKGLRFGMGEDFGSPLYDGTMDSSETSSNAFSRLRYVCVALSVLLVGNGTFPFQFEPTPADSISPGCYEGDGVSMNDVEEAAAMLERDFGKTLVLKEKAAELKSQDRKIEMAALAGAFLDGKRVFDLLFNAIGKKYHNPSTHLFRQHDHMSLWCLWNFVNVMYWQLKEMHHVESPLNGACMPDEQQQLRTIADDIRAKRKIKGEIIQFMIKTAREFAIRQTVVTQVKEKRITHCKIEGMSRSEFNKQWVRTAFDNEGQPCFTINRGEFYLYYRSLTNCWVIDDIIESTGATYCYSKNGNINSAWTVSPSWIPARFISARSSVEAGRAGAYRGEVVYITGCETVPAEASASSIDNGLYERQPPYDDINKYPHYIKDKNHPKNRRHLFLSNSRHYVVAPQCNEDQGFFIKSNSSNIDSRMVWEMIPPDQVENKVNASFIFSEDAEEGAWEMKGDDTGDKSCKINNYESELLRWQDSNHECILFNNSAHTVAFLSSKSGKLISQLHPLLVNHLNDNRISIEGGTGDDGESDSHRCWQMLAALTNMYKTDEQRKSILGGSYCLTGDALLKILAIQYRVRCGIPVVLLGECGCGKTMLLRFLCAWLDVPLMCLDVHGGTTEEDILNIFADAADALSKPLAGTRRESSVYVFLDEINTCSHMGIITEAISHRSINGVRIHEGIKVLAALNPYRRRSESCFSDVTSGLQQAKNESVISVDTSVHDMSNLVYKVHPIPDTLKDFIFDFGALSETTESLYINRMVDKKAKMPVNATERELISFLINRSQSYLREREGDPSVVSLRDVGRCIDLLNWFFFHVGGSGGGKSKVSALCRCTVLAIAHVYAYRLPTTNDRYSFWLKISAIVKSYGKDAERVQFYGLSNHGLPQRIIDNMQRRFVNNMVIEGDVSMNQALTENLFVTIVCLLNKIPIFIVGKPGTSKTLCIQIVASNLQGAQSVKPLWRNFPAVHFFQYQCSPMSTAESILFQYEAAKSYQEHSQDVLTALLLDEVGLAENSPDMPLKVLHYMLIDPPIAIVGLSNWVLDSSKMNRAVCLQRPDPSKDDIILTGKNIIGTDACSQPDSDVPTLTRQSSRSHLSKLQPFLVCLARAFHHIYSNQQVYFGGSNRRDFIGMRDYYSLLKFVKESDRQEAILDPIHGPELLSEAVSRNFGGQPSSLSAVLKVFFDHCYDLKSPHVYQDPPPVLKLIVDSLASTTSRHLMILSSNDIALQLVLGYGIIPRSGVNVLIGSHFKDDIQELHLIQQINQVKNAMAMGTVVALLNNDSMFEALYDVLNQRYVFKQDIETGKDIKMLRLALGPRSQLCPVKDGFKLIVFVDQQKAYDTLDLPLLNRFEKQVLYSKNFLDDAGLTILNQLQSWCDSICTDSNLKTLSDIFCGYYEGTLSSLLVMLTNYGRTKIVSSDLVVDSESSTIGADSLLRKAKQKMLLISYPTAILKSKLLRDEDELLKIPVNVSIDVDETPNGLSNFSEQRTSLCALLSNELFTSGEQFAPDYHEKMLLLTTKSPLPHFYLCCDDSLTCGFADKVPQHRIISPELAEMPTKVLQLALINSEQKLIDAVKSFYQSDDSKAAEVLFLLCDPMYCPDEVISHSRLLCVNEWKAFHDKNGKSSCPVRRNIVFIIHLPPGIQQRQRQFIVEYHAPWEYVFIDDLRPSSSIDGLNLSDVISQSCFSIFNQTAFKSRLLDIVQASFQSALAWRESPADSDVSYVKVIKELLAVDCFLEYIVANVLACLEMKEYDEGRDPLFFHIAIACEEYDSIGGSFRDAILSSMEHLVLQAMAHVFRSLDQDFNILTLHLHYFSCIPEWMSAAAYFHGINYTAKSCNLVIPSQMSEVDKQVFNNGLHGTLCSQYPFSYKLSELLSDETVRKRVQGLTVGHGEIQFRESVLFLTSYLESVAGKTIVKVFDLFSTMHPTGFLSDFVAFSISPAHGLSFDRHVILFTRLLDMYNVSSGLNWKPEQLYAPTSVLTFYWMHELTISHLLAILSSYHEIISENSDESCVEKSLFEVLLEELVVPVGPYMSLSFLIPHQVMLYLKSQLATSLLREDDKNMTLNVWLHLYRKVAEDLKTMLQSMFPILSMESRSNLVCQLYAVSIVNHDDLAVHHMVSLLQLWWSLSSSYCIVSEISREAENSSVESVSTGICNELQNVGIWTPFSAGDDIDILMKLCEDANISFVSMLTRYIESFVKKERDFLIRCLPDRPFLVQDCFLDKTCQAVMRLSQTELPAHKLDHKDNGCENEKEVDFLTEHGNQNVLVKQAAAVHRLHRVVIKLFKDNAVCSDDYLKSEVTTPIETQHATNVMLSVSRLCNIDIYLPSAYKFYLSTIQILLSLIEDEEITSEDLCHDSLVSAIEIIIDSEKSSNLILEMLAGMPMETLKALAVTRRALLQCASKAVENDFVSSKRDNDAIANSLVVFAGQCDISNIFFLKHLRTLGGNDSLLDYMRLERPIFPILPNAKRVESNKKIQMMNPFLTLQGSEHFISAVESCGLSTSTFATFEKWCAEGSVGLTNHQRLGLIFAVFYYKFDTLTVDIQLFKKFVIKLANGNQQSLYCSILQWISELQKSALPSKDEIVLEEIKVHAVIVAIENPNHFLIKILTDPISLKSSFLPSMPRSELEEVISAYGSSVGWYKCPNGHLYTVGACTYPMEDRRCTAQGCNARIGGQFHVVDPSNKRLDMSDAVFQGTPGYHTSVWNDAKEKLCLSDRMLRMLIHSLMVASMEMKYANIGSNGNIAKVMSHSRTGGCYIEELHEMFSKDFFKVKKSISFTVEDTSIGIHLALSLWCRQLAKGNAMVCDSQLDSHTKRSDFERSFERVACSPVFGQSNSLSYIQEEKGNFNMSDDTLLLIDTFGELNWLSILESPRILNSNLSSLRQTLWQMREPVSFDIFCRHFQINSSLASQYPVLDVVLQNEASLELVNYIGDILAWHKFLFTNLSSKTTREQAASIKNSDFVESIIDPDKQAEGWKVLNSFCIAFNAAFHLVEFLYECNPNPFLTDDGAVDLTGSRGKSGSTCVEQVGMNFQTTLNFSLPSASHGETDATGLCTIKLLSSLEEAHNTVIATLHRAKATANITHRASEAENVVGATSRSRKRKTNKVELRPGLTPAEQTLRATRNNEVHDDDAKADINEQSDRATKIVRRGQGTTPTTHHGTPINIIMRRLIHYKRETILLPLIAAAANQSMEFGSGGRIQGFDFDLVEEELTETLLATSSPLALQCAQFSYAGEIRKSGGLRRLGAKISQKNLAASLIEQILTEIDTQMRLTNMIRVLEDCIAFINQMSVTMSTTGANSMLLEDYVLNTLLLKPDKWDEIKCPSVVQHVQLCNLQSLFLALESKRDAVKEGGGDPLDKVALKYREPLPDAAAAILRSSIAVGAIDLGIFIPLLREFANEQLCTDGWPADAGLKEYMGYSSETDLDDLTWFVDSNILPDELELRHAYSLYHLFFDS